MKATYFIGIFLILAVLLADCAPQETPVSATSTDVEPVMVTKTNPVGSPTMEKPTEHPELTPTTENEEGQMTKEFSVSSAAYNSGETIPTKYSCDGENISPPLEWSGTPPEAQSIAIIFDDPDAPSGTFVHMVLFNISADADGLYENVEANLSPLGEPVFGKNGRGQNGYTGPCPPGETHRYFFKVYALDTMLDLTEGVTAAQLESAMEGHILAQAELMGEYTR